MQIIYISFGIGDLASHGRSKKVQKWTENGLKNTKSHIYFIWGIDENGDFVVEHLARVSKNSNLMWKHPTPCDIKSVEPEQVFDCVIDEEWDNLSDRNRKYKLKNDEMVQNNFKKMQ